MLALILGVGAAGCSDNNNNNTSDNYMRCKLNGTLWQSTTDNVGGMYNSTGQLLTFSGDDGSTMVTANISNVPDTGSYPMGPGTGRDMSFFYNNVFYYINTNFGSGTLHLTEIKTPVMGSSYIEAEFSGVAVSPTNDSLFVTEGEVETF